MLSPEGRYNSCQVHTVQNVMSLAAIQSPTNKIETSITPFGYPIVSNTIDMLVNLYT